MIDMLRLVDKDEKKNKIFAIRSYLRRKIKNSAHPKSPAPAVAKTAPRVFQGL